MIEDKDNFMAFKPFMWSAIAGIFLLIAVAFLLWVGKQPEHITIVECEITTPYGDLKSGWKIMGPEDESMVNALARTGQVEKKPIDGLVSCTRYEEHKTPVTSKYALILWRSV